MFYANLDLGGGTYAYKKHLLKIVENCHAYYMPDLGGMSGLPYREVSADHHVYARTSDRSVLARIIDVLGRRYKFHPLVTQLIEDDKVYGSDDKTYRQLKYEKRDYIGQEVYPGEYEEEEVG